MFCQIPLPHSLIHCYLLEMNFSKSQSQINKYCTSFIVDLTGPSLVFLNHRELMRANRCPQAWGTMSSSTTCWDKIDQRRDPVILCQSLADVQRPLVTIRVLCALCASMSKCTCLLLTLNPPPRAGRELLAFNVNVCLLESFLRGGTRCPSAWHVRTEKRPSTMGHQCSVEQKTVSCCMLHWRLLSVTHERTNKESAEP